MQDDFNDLEEMIYNNASFAEIAIDLSKNIVSISSADQIDGGDGAIIIKLKKL